MQDHLGRKRSGYERGRVVDLFDVEDLLDDRDRPVQDDRTVNQFAAQGSADRVGPARRGAAAAAAVTASRSSAASARAACRLGDGPRSGWGGVARLGAGGGRGDLTTGMAADGCSQQVGMAKTGQRYVKPGLAAVHEATETLSSPADEVDQAAARIRTQLRVSGVAVQDQPPRRYCRMPAQVGHDRMVTSDQDEAGDYLVARLFAQRWADGTLRQATRLRDALQRASSLDRAYERMDDPTLTEWDIAARIDEVWVEQHLLMVSAQQFEKWAKRMAEARGETRPEEDRLMRLLRNSLEHLDEAELNDIEALPGLSGNRSLRDLPGSRLPLGVTLGTDKVMVCDLVELDAIETNCRQLANEILDEIERPVIDAYIQRMIDDARGK